MMLKRIFAFFLAILFTVMTFASCVDGNVNTTETTAEETTEEETTAEETTAEETTAEETTAEETTAEETTAEETTAEETTAEETTAEETTVEETTEEETTAEETTAEETTAEETTVEETTAEETTAEEEPFEETIPTVYMYDMGGNVPLTDLQKSQGEIVVKYKYVSGSKDIDSFECYCEIKIQGASSAGYPKKNFTVKFFKDADLESKLKVDLGWGKENKYCMKANYVDSSQARNVVGAKLFAQVVASRENINPGLASAPNGGVIDGYPVLVYINDQFHGIYTMNIPKDEWMFGMEGDEDSREALLMADRWSDSVQLKQEIGGDFEDYGWEVEYCSTDDETWIKDSFNELISLINCGDKAIIKAELANHLDIEAAIDNMLFTYFISAADNLAKNVLWATYDGKVWIPSMYDMDGTFGIYFNGQPLGTYTAYDAKPNCPSVNPHGLISIEASASKLYIVLLECFGDEVEARWKFLRQDILTVENASKIFDEFFEKIPKEAYRQDFEKWPSVPYFDNNLKSMYRFLEAHAPRLDKFFNTFNKFSK